MLLRSKTLVALAALAGVSSLASVPAAAECTRLGFSVNDYGKDGPTKDAKELLDKHIAKTMADRGISKYTVGKKDVSCELFLNLILFDEHTCKAEATVCWGGSALKKTDVEDAAAQPVAPVKTKAVATPKPKPVVETGALPDRDASAADKAAAAADAAERAAAAAERAAAAAERAAAASAPAGGAAKAPVAAAPLNFAPPSPAPSAGQPQ